MKHEIHFYADSPMMRIYCYINVTIYIATLLLLTIACKREALSSAGP